MTLSELASRVDDLEAQVAYLRDELERTRVLAGIRRGLDAANAGHVKPARQALDDLRHKLGIPQT